MSNYSRLGGALLGAAKSGCADRGAPDGLNEAGRGMSELGIPLSDVVAEFMSGQALTNCLQKSSIIFWKLNSASLGEKDDGVDAGGR